MKCEKKVKRHCQRKNMTLVKTGPLQPGPSSQVSGTLHWGFACGRGIELNSEHRSVGFIATEQGTVDGREQNQEEGGFCINELSKNLAKLGVLRTHPKMVPS